MTSQADAVDSAAPLAPAAAPEEPELPQFLTCHIGAEMIAMRIEQLRGIVEFRGLTEVPMTPDFFRGVFNLRGSVIPVIDLAQRLGRGPTPVMRRACIVIVELAADAGMILVGVLVAGARTVIAAALSPVDVLPDGGVSIQADFIEGMITVDERAVMALNMQRTLAPDDLALLIGGGPMHRA